MVEESRRDGRIEPAGPGGGVSGWAIYGAYGYSGRLAARHAVERGERPLLLGRSSEKLRTIAEELDLEFAAVDLDDHDGMRRALIGVSAVVHAAGPFRETWEPMARACLATRTHYLDITGDVGVMESLRRLDGEFLDAELTVMPGAAFDVIPSDCLALHLKSRLPDATHLTIAVAALTRPSPGTAASVAARLSEGSQLRRHGLLVDDDPAADHRVVDFGWDVGVHDVYRLEWGDLSTAHHSTGIPNIETYLPLDKVALAGVRAATRVPWAARSSLVRRALVRVLTQGRPGPDDAERAGSHGAVWGEVTNGSRWVGARVRTPHPYTFTAMGMVETARRVAAGEAGPGFQTPGSAFGPDYVLTFEGTDRVAA